MNSRGERILNSKWGWFSLYSSNHRAIFFTTAAAPGTGLTQRQSRFNVRTNAAETPLLSGLATGVQLHC